MCIHVRCNRKNNEDYYGLETNLVNLLILQSTWHICMYLVHELWGCSIYAYMTWGPIYKVDVFKANIQWFLTVILVRILFVAKSLQLVQVPGNLTILSILERRLGMRRLQNTMQLHCDTMDSSCSQVAYNVQVCAWTSNFSIIKWLQKSVTLTSPADLTQLPASLDSLILDPQIASHYGIISRTIETRLRMRPIIQRLER